MKNNQPENPGDANIQPWLEAQKLFLENWINLASMATSSTPASRDLLGQWQKAAQQSFEAWIAASDSIAKSTAEQIYALNETALSLIAFSARSWQAMAPNIESGEDWISAYKESVAKMSEGWSQNLVDFTEITQDTSKMWQLYLDRWQLFGQPWVNAMRQASEQLDQASTGGSDTLIGLSNLYRDTYQQTMGRLISSPYLGPTRELGEKLSQGFDSWVEWQLAIFNYQSLLIETWNNAMGRFLEKLVLLAEKGEKIDNLRDTLKLWTQEAEQVFTETFRTDEYVLAQGKMINTAMAYRKSERVIIEEYQKIYDLPTRSELDEAHRRIYELRKEVKELKKSLETSSKKGRKGV